MIYLLILFLIIFIVTFTIYLNKNPFLKDKNFMYKILYKILIEFPKWFFNLFSSKNNDYTSTFKIHVEDDNIMPKPSKNNDTHYANSGSYMYNENDKETEVQDTKIVTNPEIISKLHI